MSGFRKLGHICKIYESSVPADISDDGIQQVLDGGTLLQHMPWSHGSTYGDICHQYTEYVARKYKNAIIVFDDYENMNTKDMTNQRQSKGKAGATVTVAANMTTTMKKDYFQVNQKNKQQFIFMLSTKLEKNNCKTYHAPGDADLLIVQKAVQSATTSKTVLVGEDIDLFSCFDTMQVLIPMTSSFVLSQRKTQRNFASRTSKTQKKSMVKTSEMTSSLSMLWV